MTTNINVSLFVIFCSDSLLFLSFQEARLWHLFSWLSSSNLLARQSSCGQLSLERFLSLKFRQSPRFRGYSYFQRERRGSPGSPTGGSFAPGFPACERCERSNRRFLYSATLLSAPSGETSYFASPISPSFLRSYLNPSRGRGSSWADRSLLNC